jgi:hypothetical protein
MLPTRSVGELNPNAAVGHLSKEKIGAEITGKSYRHFWKQK